MSRLPRNADSMRAYYCGWAITGRTAVSHLVTSAEFPLAGSQHRAWCGQTITVVGLTLNARDLRRSCVECNQRLRMMMTTQRAQ